MATRNIRDYPVHLQLLNQSYLAMEGHSVRWVESQDPEYRRYQEYRASQRNHEPASSDPVVDSVKQQLQAKSRNRGISIAPASAPDGRK